MRILHIQLSNLTLLTNNLAHKLKLCQSLCLYWSDIGRVIEPFQRGETSTFMEHIRAGLEGLEDRPTSLLVFSGWLSSNSDAIEAWLSSDSGATKQNRTPLSEGESYLVCLLPSQTYNISYEISALISLTPLEFSERSWSIQEYNWLAWQSLCSEPRIPSLIPTSRAHVSRNPRNRLLPEPSLLHPPLPHPHLQLPHTHNAGISRLQTRPLSRVALSCYTLATLQIRICWDRSAGSCDAKKCVRAGWDGERVWSVGGWLVWGG